MSTMKPELLFIKEMFDKVAPRYDLLNRILSLRQDVYWRRAMVNAVDIPNKGAVLDIACGTGDVLIEILRQKGPEVAVFGIDFSHPMLIRARNKIKKIPLGSNIHLVAANAFNIPFQAKMFDLITIAFGIRNISNKLSALKVCHASLKKGGALVVLELATPRKGLLLSSYLIYFTKILPLIGRFFSKNQMAYKYLPDSVIDFPDSETFSAIIGSAGFSNVRWKKLTMGIATLYVGYKNSMPLTAKDCPS